MGLAVLGCGIALLFSYPYLRDWTLFALATPVLLAGGAAMAGYAGAATAGADDTGAGRRDSQWPRPGRQFTAVAAPVCRRCPGRRHRGEHLLGHGNDRAVVRSRPRPLQRQPPRPAAQHHYRHPRAAPSAVSRRRGNVAAGVIGSDVSLSVPASAYQGKDRMFLVPDHWSASDSTMIVALYGTVRVQSQSRNDPP